MTIPKIAGKSCWNHKSLFTDFGWDCLKFQQFEGFKVFFLFLRSLLRVNAGRSVSLFSFPVYTAQTSIESRLLIKIEQAQPNAKQANHENILLQNFKIKFKASILMTSAQLPSWMFCFGELGLIVAISEECCKFLCQIKVE